MSRETKKRDFAGDNSMKTWVQIPPPAPQLIEASYDYVTEMFSS